MRDLATDAGWGGAPVLALDGKPVKRTRIAGFTTATVFDISQTDGAPLPDGGTRELTEDPPPGLKDDLQAAITDAGFTVTYEDIQGSASG